MIQVLVNGPDTLVYPPGNYEITYENTSNSNELFLHIVTDRHYTKIELEAHLKKHVKKFDFISHVNGPTQPITYNEYEAQKEIDKINDNLQKANRIFK